MKRKTEKQLIMKGVPPEKEELISRSEKQEKIESIGERKEEITNLSFWNISKKN